ncbi:MAG TPA: hypothetical protein VHB25_14510 [Gemmatimonadaceae bacterium]|nr:hypothetical protein [Gemmatimonadaceae bacterium]
MHTLWKLFKVGLALAIAIPLGLIVLATTMGILGALFGLAVLVLKLAVIGLIGYGVFRLVRGMFAPAPKPPVRPALTESPPVDPYYAAAMRELDSELRR